MAAATADRTTQCDIRAQPRDRPRPLVGAERVSERPARASERAPRSTMPARGGRLSRPRQGRRLLPARDLSPREPLLAAAAGRDRGLRRRRARADRVRGLVDAAADSLSTLTLGSARGPE